MAQHALFKFGGTASKVLHSFTRPLLLVRTRIVTKGVEVCEEGTCTNYLDNILYCTDFSDTAQRAFEYVEGLVAAGGKRVTLMHVQDKGRIDKHPAHKAVAFTRSHMVDWRTALPLLAITTLVAPLGVWILRFVPTTVVWWIYVGVLVFLAYRMAFAPKRSDAQEAGITDGTRVKGGLLSVVIGVFAGFLGVGPGFLLMPTLVMLGYSARIAAATNSVIVTLPSFSAFIAHLADAQFDWVLVGMTSVTSVLGAYYGSMFMARRVKSRTLTRIFAVALVLLTLQRVAILVSAS